MSNLPKAIAESSFTVFGVTVRCYVLDNGQRILRAEDVGALLRAMAEPDAPKPDEAELRRMAEFIKGVKK